MGWLARGFTLATSVALAVAFVAPPAQASTLAAPGAVSATVASSNVAFGQGRVEVSWSAVTGALGYAVSARAGGGVVTTTTVSAPITSATLTGLTGGVTYDIVVQTGNASGFGAASAPVQATALTVPETPAIGNPTTTDTTTTVTWSEPNNGGAPITSYTITQVATGLVVADLTGTSHTFAGITLTNAADYTVRAFNVVGGSATGGASASTPSAPRSLSATASNRVITATWAAPASTGGSPITNYTATLSIGGSVVQTLTVNALSTAFAAVNAGNYAVQVRANNANGAGLPASTAISVQADGSGGGGGGAGGGGGSDPGTGVAPGTVDTTPAPVTPVAPIAAPPQLVQQPRPTASVPARITAQPGAQQTVTLARVRNVAPRALVLRISSAGKRATPVKARFTRQGANIRMAFDAPRKAGTYRLQIMQQTPTGLVQVATTRLRVSRGSR